MREKNIGCAARWNGSRMTNSSGYPNRFLPLQFLQNSALRSGHISMIGSEEGFHCPRHSGYPRMLVTSLPRSGPRAVLLKGFVDGRNRPLSESESKLQLQPGFPTTQSVSPRITVRESSSPTGLATWLNTQLLR